MGNGVHHGNTITKRVGGTKDEENRIQDSTRFYTTITVGAITVVMVFYFFTSRYINHLMTLPERRLIGSLRNIGKDEGRRIQLPRNSAGSTTEHTLQAQEILLNYGQCTDGHKRFSEQIPRQQPAGTLCSKISRSPLRLWQAE